MPDNERYGQEGGEGTPKPKRKKKRLIVLAALLIGLVASGGYAVSRFGLFKTSADVKKAKPADQEQQTDQTSTNGKSTLLPEMHDKEVKKIVELPPFILNLADKDDNRFLRLTLSLGIGEDGDDKPDIVFLTRIRNAVLAVLSSKTSTEVLSDEGKAALRKQLLQAVREAADKPHVSAVYITELIVQQ